MKYQYKKPEPPKCQYNEGVVCFPKKKQCNRCGWCPSVAERRAEQRQKKVRP